MSDDLVIGDKRFKSRFILGSGKFSLEMTDKVIRNGGVEVPSDVIVEALGRLSELDRDFALAVLGGKSWREMGMPKATFYRRLKKVEAEVRLTPSKSSLKT